MTKRALDFSVVDARFRIGRVQQSDNTARPSRRCWPLTPTEHAGTFVPSPVRPGAQNGE